MFTEYVVFPDAMEKLEKNGIVEKIKKIIPKINHLYGAFYDDDIFNMLKELEERGYPLDFLDNWKNEEWEVKYDNEIIKKKAEHDDIPLITGYLASYVLSPEDLKNFKNFGFDSYTDFIGTVGAAIKQISDEKSYDCQQGFISDKNGIRTQIASNMHGDPFILITDKREFPSKDPFGNNIHYRPILNENKRNLHMYQYAENELLATLLTYIYQTKFKSDLLEDNAKKLREFLIKTDINVQRNNYLDDSSRGIRWDFIAGPIPSLDEKNIVEYTDKEGKPWINQTNISYGTQKGYKVYIDSDNNLLFSTDINNDFKPKKRYFTIYTNEIDDVIKGMFLCKGRISKSTLLNLVNYSLSGEYEKDQKEYYDRIKENTVKR